MYIDVFGQVVRIPDENGGLLTAIQRRPGGPGSGVTVPAVGPAFGGGLRVRAGPGGPGPAALLLLGQGGPGLGTSGLKIVAESRTPT